MPVIAISKRAIELLSNAEAKELATIPGATHLFKEPWQDGRSCTNSSRLV